MTQRKRCKSRFRPSTSKPDTRRKTHGLPSRCRSPKFLKRSTLGCFPDWMSSRCLVSKTLGLLGSKLGPHLAPLVREHVLARHSATSSSLNGHCSVDWDWPLTTGPSRDIGRVRADVVGELSQGPMRLSFYVLKQVHTQDNSASQI